MTVDISFSKAPLNDADTAVICFYKGQEQSSPVASFNYEVKGFIDYALSKSKNFTGGFGQVEILMLPKDAPYTYGVLLGCGEKGKLDSVKCEQLGGKLMAALDGRNIEGIEFYVDNDLDDAAEKAVQIATGLALRSYKFEQYKSKKELNDDEPEKKNLEHAHFVLFNSEVAKEQYADKACVIDGVFLARDLTNEPPNELYPDAYAKYIKKQLKPYGVEIEILDEKKMKKLGMGAILAVGQGSDSPSRMVIMRWRGDKSSKDAPLAFVGKGVTFDTGGISLKPGLGMEDMKMDMGGSAAVVGLIKALAMRKAKVNVVGVVGLVENMPSAHAYRPADIVKTYKGKTIEVLNTDAEGRLVLADALEYVQDIYKPDLVIDLATLTGAMVVALGHEYCGTYCNDDELWQQMEQAGKATGEALWRMPLDKVWKEEMEGTITDVQNMGKGGATTGAGSCTAAGFLSHFIKEGTVWAHMDIAGVARIKKDKDVVPKHGTGFGVRVLERFVSQNYEK